MLLPILSQVPPDVKIRPSQRGDSVTTSKRIPIIHNEGANCLPLLYKRVVRCLPDGRVYLGALYLTLYRPCGCAAQSGLCHFKGEEGSIWFAERVYQMLLGGVS